MCLNSRRLCRGFAVTPSPLHPLIPHLHRPLTTDHCPLPLMESIANPPATDTADLLAKVADEFSAAVERGEHPDIEAYAGQYPKIADILRDVLPALTLMNRSSLDDEFPSEF